MTRDAKIIYTAEDRTQAGVASVKRGLLTVQEAAAAAGLSLAVLGSAGSLAGLVSMVKQVSESIDRFNDLKDATGASIENISALERVAIRTGANFDTVQTSLIKFNQALGQTVKPGSDAEKVLQAIGLNAKQLRDMDPAEALQKTAVALAQFADDGEKARGVQEMFGKSLREVAPFLKDLAESGDLVATVTTRQAEEAEKFNKQLYALKGNLTDLGRTVANPVISTLNDLIDKFKEARREGANIPVSISLVMGDLPILTPQQGAGWLGGKLRQMLFGKDTGPNGFSDARVGIENINEALKDLTLTESERNGLLRERVRLQAQLASYLNSGAGAGRGLGGYEFARPSMSLPQEAPKPVSAKPPHADPAAIEVMRRYADTMGDLVRLTNELTAKNEGLSRTQARLREDMSSPVWQQYSMRQQEEIILKASLAQAAEDEAEARKAATESLKGYTEFLERVQSAEQTAYAAIATRVADLRMEAETYGMLESQIAQVTLARLEDMRAAAAAGGESTTWLDLQIEKQRELIGLLQNKEVREANKREAEAQAQLAADALRDWQRTNEQIANSFVDNLMRGGKSVAQYLKDLFRTLVLRPILQPIGQAAAGVVGSMFGGNAFAGTAGSMGGNSLLGPLMNPILSATGAFGSAASGVAQGVFLGAGELSSLGFGEALSGGFAALGEGAIASGLGTLAGVLGPIAMGVMLLASLAKGGETRIGGQYSGTNFLGGPSGGQINGAQSLLGGNISNINATLAALGSSNSITNYVSGLEQSSNGKGFAYAGGSLNNGVVFGQGVDGSGYMNRRGDMSEQQALAAFQEELAQTKLEAIAASDAVGPLADWVRSLGDISLITGDALASTVARLDKAVAERQTLEARLFDLTATEAEKLAKAREQERAAIDPTNLALLEQIYAQQDLKTATEALTAAQEEAARAAAQAADDLLAKLRAVRPFFMSDEEVKQMTANEIAGTFNSKTGANITPEFVLGLTAEDYRTYFEEFVAQGNQAAIAAMIDLAPAFQTLVQSVQDAVDQAAADALRISNERQGLQMQYWQLIGDTKSIRDAILQTLDPSNRALQQLIWDTEDAAKAEAERQAALQRTAAAARALQQELHTLADGLLDAARQIRGDSMAPAQLQAQFSILTAQARAGGAAGRRAAELLPQLAQQIVSTGRYTSLADQRLAENRVAASLEMTAGFVKAQAATDAVVDELKQLRRERTERDKKQADAEERHRKLTDRMVNVLERWEEVGMPLERAS